MDLSEKVGKLTNGRAFESAKRHIRRFVLARYSPVPLNPASLIKSIDGRELEAIRQRHSLAPSASAWSKYFDLPHWMAINLQRVLDLELNVGSPQRILDLGCGAGYFLFISQCLGHDVLGLDLDEVPMFREMMRLLGLPRVTWRVRPFVPLPALGKKFDLVTAFMVCFNGHRSPTLWGPSEWEFFLYDLETHLTPRGRIWLGFNREDDGSFLSRELRIYFERRDARLKGNCILLGPSQRMRTKWPHELGSFGLLTLGTQ